MEIGKLIAMLAVTLTVASAAMAVGAALTWRMHHRERWLAAITPLALAAGFVAGYGWLLDFPRTWTAEAWKMGVLAAAVAGVVLAIVQTLPARGVWMAARAVMIVGMLALVAWLTVRRFTQPQPYYAAVGCAFIAYAASFSAVTCEPRLWLTGTLALMLTGCAASLLTLAWVDLNTVGRMMVMVTALTGLPLLAGIARLPALARGSLPFLMVMLAVMLTMVARYRGASMPWWVFVWIGAGPLAAAVGWLPALRRRPWWCAALASMLTLAITVPAVVMAMSRAAATDYGY